MSTQINSAREVVCDFSDINVQWCAHCLGHTLPAEYEAVAE
jgi:hypothetical protein